jgi:ABC-type lipoprotein export system ATPase subunit
MILHGIIGVSKITGMEEVSLAALDNVSLNNHKGVFVSISGPSGPQVNFIAYSGAAG